jgi:hypothetical protein
MRVAAIYQFILIRKDSQKSIHFNWKYQPQTHTARIASEDDMWSTNNVLVLVYTETEQWFKNKTNRTPHL